MESKNIGVIGIDCYEIVLSLAILCTGYGEKVLIVDISFEEEFKYIVPVPEEMCMSIDIVHWMGIDFTSDSSYVQRSTNDIYQRVFIYYGLYGVEKRWDNSYLEINNDNCDEYILVLLHKKVILERSILCQRIYEKVNHIMIKYIEDKDLSDQRIANILGLKEWMKLFLVENGGSIQSLQSIYEGKGIKGKVYLPHELKEYFKQQLKLWFATLDDKQVKSLIENLIVKRKGINCKSIVSTKERSGLLEDSILESSTWTRKNHK